ncbi:trehalose-phosphatase, partial [Leucobacter sp. M11]|uniref:trehalose-phosphatase n=1 Tax=Leucobacter sp. M11 TaxID=2993565 RepID=UPI002D7E8E7A
MIAEALDRELERLAGVGSLLVAVDFDGTVAPIVTHADHARILPEAEDALARLQAVPGTRVALVSGRSLASLSRTGVPTEGRVLAGSHGAELVGLTEPAGPTPGRAELRPPLTDEERSRLAGLRAALEALLDGGPARHGAWLEDKPAGVAVHTRALTENGSAGVL